MVGNFNIRDNFQDPIYPHNSTHSDLLIDITDSLLLELSYPTNSVPTRYLDNDQSSNLVIDLIFLRYSSEELDNHTIYPEQRLSSDHTSLTITIPIKEQHTHNRKHSITQDSMEEKLFIKDTIKDISTINTSNLSDIKSLENVIDSFTIAIKKAWEKNSKIINISRHSKSWCDINCSRDLEIYRSTRSLANWKQFKKIVKYTKCSFFDQKIQEISNKTRRPQKLMNQIKKRNLPAVKAIKYNNRLCLEINNLWHTLYSTFNLAQDCHVNIKVLNEISDKSPKEWPPFSKEEFTKAIAKCNNLSASRPNKLSQSHLKCIINNKAYLGKIISIANICFELELWLLHFKSLMTIIIPKPNKKSYDSPKSF